MNKPILKKKDKKEILKIINNILVACDKNRWSLVFSREDLQEVIMNQVVDAVIYGRESKLNEYSKTNQKSLS